MKQLNCRKWVLLFKVSEVFILSSDWLRGQFKFYWLIRRSCDGHVTVWRSCDGLTVMWRWIEDRKWHQRRWVWSCRHRYPKTRKTRSLNLWFDPFLFHSDDIIQTSSPSSDHSWTGLSWFCSTGPVLPVSGSNWSRNQLQTGPNWSSFTSCELLLVFTNQTS